MAYTVRRVPDAIVFALVAAWNARQEAGVGSNFHADITQLTSGDHWYPTVANDTISTANASDLATSVALVNAIKKVVNRHFQDPRAHNTAVTAVVSTADATDLATGITLGNAIKTAYEAHRVAANVHFTNDATNTIAAVNATDQSSLNTLLNELKTDINAHIIGAPVGSMINIVDA